MPGLKFRVLLDSKKETFEYYDANSHYEAKKKNKQEIPENYIKNYLKLFINSIIVFIHT